MHPPLPVVALESVKLQYSMTESKSLLPTYIHPPSNARLPSNVHPLTVRPPLDWIAPPSLPVLSKNVQLYTSNVPSDVIDEVLCPTPLIKLIFLKITWLLNANNLESPKPLMVMFLPSAPIMVKVVEPLSTTIPELARAISEFCDSLKV